MSEHRSSSDSRLNTIWSAAESRGIPLRTILASVAVVALVYLAGQLVYRIRDIILIVVIAGFVALILNPFVVALQHWHLKRRGQALAVVALVAVLLFIALALAFGYPLVNGLTHLADRLPTYIRQAEQGKGWIGHLVRRYHVESSVNKNAPKLTSFAEEPRKTGPATRQRCPHAIGDRVHRFRARAAVAPRRVQVADGLARAHMGRGQIAHAG